MSTDYLCTIKRIISDKSFLFPLSIFRSADDPFMLYAALHSGQNASVVTNDELRDHRFLLGAELAGLLKMWQRGHQVLFSGLRKQSGKEFPIFKVYYSSYYYYFLNSHFDYFLFWSFLLG